MNENDPDPGWPSDASACHATQYVPGSSVVGTVTTAGDFGRLSTVTAPTATNWRCGLESRTVTALGCTDSLNHSLISAGLTVTVSFFARFGPSQLEVESRDDGGRCVMPSVRQQPACR